MKLVKCITESGNIYSRLPQLVALQFSLLLIISRKPDKPIPLVLETFILNCVFNSDVNYILT